MDKEILYEILNSKSEKYSTSTIESILNEELDKSPDEMDTDLVDICLEALTNVDKEQLNKKKPRIIFTKILAAAVIFVLVIGISIPAFAKFFSVNVPEGIVNIYKNCFNIDISNKEYISNNIYIQLENDGFENVVLPNIIFSTQTGIYNYMTYSDTLCSSAEFKFSFDDVYGSVTINKYNEHHDFIIGEYKETLEMENVEYFKKDNIEGIISSNKDVIHLCYTESNNEYDIAFKGNLTTASEIIEAFINEEVIL